MNNYNTVLLLGTYKKIIRENKNIILIINLKNNEDILIPILINDCIAKNIESCICENYKLAIKGYITQKENSLTIIASKISYINI